MRWKERLNQHLNSKSEMLISQYIRYLKSKGLHPDFKELDRAEEKDHLFVELYWINQLKTWGFILLNSKKLLNSKVLSARTKKSNTYMFKNFAIGQVLEINRTKINSFKNLLRSYNKTHDPIFFVFSKSDNGKISATRVEAVPEQIIYCFSKDGCLLNTYKKLSQVSNDGFTPSSVSAALKGKLKTAGKCIWIAENKKEFGIEKRIKKTLILK